jgi:hypothetical protein
MLEARWATGAHENQYKDEEDERATTDTGRGCDIRDTDGTWAVDSLGFHRLDFMMEAKGAARTHNNQDTDEQDERTTTGTGRGCDRRDADDYRSRINKRRLP